MRNFLKSPAFKLGIVMAMFTILPNSVRAASELIEPRFRGLTFATFALVISLTLIATWYAARRNASARDFYTGGGISGRANGLAIAGDYLSAAAFLGVSGLISLYGYDGILYLIGFFVAFIPVLLLIAEPCRNLGRYTLGDVLAYRNNYRASKIVAALSSIVVAIFYLIPQIVGGATLIKALVGFQYEASVVMVGLLMLIYVLFGGMRATTYVQIIKAILLLFSCALIVVLSLSPFGFDVNSLFNEVLLSPKVTHYFTTAFQSQNEAVDGTSLARKFFEPGLYLKNPVEQVSLGLALTLGTAALPHILMRFFTVKDARTARSSVLWAMLWIGVCHLMIIVIGFSAAYYVGPSTILAADKGGTLAAPLLAQYLGGGANSFAGNLLLGWVAAVAFATIVAVVAGLTLAAASALAHDIYVGAIRRGEVSEREQVIAAKAAAAIVGVVAIVLSIQAKGQNVAHLSSLAYAVAASANLPALLLTLYWRRCSTVGVCVGVVGGTLAAVLLVLVSPNMQYPLLERAQAERTQLTAARTIENLKLKMAVSTGTGRDELAAELSKARAAIASAQASIDALRDRRTSLVGLEAPLFPLRNPALVTVPFGFMLVFLFSLLFPDPRAQSIWTRMVAQRETGANAAAAISH
ncbi:solute symporter family protein [Cupriavidus consociatus]|uniref:solute symporter family protein n=1 Tax=Cupriavidus consociatus TaxID=2821357 RepID=UPI001AE43E74|nr:MULTISPECIES: cation acetate symporter [unclassified Cupriavidus]MBP0623105.1 cation acetate symporter [Cupriavidus sp. LEh25]MDK2659796.1 cation acetate symporter [Cupriavidus sp. LEh21]